MSLTYRVEVRLHEITFNCKHSVDLVLNIKVPRAWICHIYSFSPSHIARRASLITLVDRSDSDGVNLRRGWEVTDHETKEYD